MNLKKILRLLALMAIGFSFCLSAQAQRGWELGAGVGVSHYFGDLNTNYRVEYPHLAVGLHARYNFNNRLCLKLAGHYTNIEGADENSNNPFENQRNLSFKNRIVEGSAQFEFNFLPYQHGSSSEWFTPYLLAGFSIFNHTPEAEYGGETYKLREMGTEGQFRGEEYSTNATAFLFGGGFKFDINYRWSVNIEMAVRKPYTDYIDDVSGNYADGEDIENLRGPVAALLADRSFEVLGTGENIGEAGRQRGNGKENDLFGILEVSMLYYFGKVRCPEFYR